MPKLALQLKSNYAAEAKYEAYFTGKHVQVTKDGGTLFCESEDSVGVLMLETGKVSSRIPIENDVVSCISLAPNNSSLIVALRSSSVQQYQWPGLELQRSFRSYHRGPVTVMAWDASSTLLITGAADSSARIWDLEQKFCTHSLKGASGVFRCVLFHPDLTEEPYVYGAVANNIHIWQLAAGSSSLKATLEGHHSAVTAIEMTSDKAHLVSSGLDRVLIVWDMKTMTSKRVVPVMESLSGMLLQPKGAIFPGAKAEDDHIYSLVIGDKGVPSVWQVDTGRQVWKASSPLLTLPSEEGASLINQLLYSAALDSVIFTAYDHSIHFAKVSSLNVWKQLSGYNDQILDAVFVGAGNSHLAVATNSPQIRIYNVTNFSCHLMQGHTKNVYALSNHPTQPDLFASSSHDNSARVWCLQADGSASCIAMAVGHTNSVGCVALSKGFMLTGSNDMCLKSWDISNVSGSGGPVKTPVALTSTHTQVAHEKDINSLCISVNHKLVASGSQDKTAKVWDSSDLSLLGVLRGHRRGIWCVQFSPVEEILATASADGTIKIWALSDFSNAMTLEGHEVSVMRLAWVSQGQQMLSIGSDGLLKLWTIKTRQCIQTYDEHEDRIWALAVSHDETKLITGGEDAALVTWRDVTQEEKEKELAEAARLASEEQTLSNLIEDKKWGKALGIAIRLNQPLRGLRIIKEILDDSPEELPNVLKKFRHDQLESILDFASQWNTKTKNSREAQHVLNIILRNKMPEDLEGIRDWRRLLEGLLPYTDRHLRRVSALHQASAILKYMSSSLTLSDNIPLGGSVQPIDDLQLLHFVESPQPHEPGSDEEDEGVDVDSNSEDGSISESVREAVTESIMEVGENEDALEGENESDSSSDDDLTQDEMDIGNRKSNTAAGTSIDDLDANFVYEEVEAESSEDESDLNNSLISTDKTQSDTEQSLNVKGKSSSKQEASIDALNLGKPRKMKKKNSNFKKERKINSGDFKKKSGSTIKGKKTSVKKKKQKIKS